LFPPGAPVLDQLLGAEEAPCFICSGDQVEGAAEGVACVDSEVRGTDWDCDQAPGFAPLDQEEALGVAGVGAG
jgi:hypothetical protein